MPRCVPEKHGPSTTALGGDPRDGTDWTLEVDWSASTALLEVRLIHETTGHETAMNEPVDLLGLLGPSAYVAVTAATGDFKSAHVVRSLRLEGGGLSSRTLRKDLMEF